MKKEGATIMDSIENHTIKITLGVAVTVIIFLLIMSFNLATWKGDMEHRIEDVDIRQAHLAEKYVTIRTDIDDLTIQANSRDIQLTEIKTKLANIELLLIEIKQDIKEK